MRFFRFLALTASGVIITLLNAIERFSPVISLTGSLLALAGGWYAFRLKRLEYLARRSFIRAN